jgi:hypothetical protein
VSDAFAVAWDHVRALEADGNILAWLEGADLSPGVRLGLQAFLVMAIRRVADRAMSMNMPLSWVEARQFPLQSLQSLIAWLRTCRSS